MSKDKFRTFIHSSRIVLWLLTIAATIAWALILKNAINSSTDDVAYVLVLYVLGLAWIFLISFAIASLFLKIKEIKTKNHRYVIYLGWIKDVLLCDGVVVDMFKGMSFSAVNLEYEDELDGKIAVRISQLFFNTYTFKVNGKVLY